MSVMGALKPGYVRKKVAEIFELVAGPGYETHSGNFRVGEKWSDKSPVEIFQPDFD